MPDIPSAAALKPLPSRREVLDGIAVLSDCAAPGADRLAARETLEDFANGVESRAAMRELLTQIAAFLARGVPILERVERVLAPSNMPDRVRAFFNAQTVAVILAVLTALGIVQSKDVIEVEPPETTTRPE